MRKKPPMEMMERDKIRGLVPSRACGSQDKVFGAYLNTLQPRANDCLQFALAASDDIRFREFLDRIQMPRYRKVSPQTIAKACNINLKEFQNWWNRESSQQALAIAQNSSIAVTQDLVEDAMSKKIACERCDGLGWISAPNGLPDDTPGYRSIQSGDDELWIRDCPNCEKGKIRKPGDAHARDRVLEMGGLVNKSKSGLTLVQNFGGASHASAIDQLDKVMAIDIDS